MLPLNVSELSYVKTKGDSKSLLDAKSVFRAFGIKDSRKIGRFMTGIDFLTCVTAKNKKACRDFQYVVIADTGQLSLFCDAFYNSLGCDEGE